MLTGYKIRYVKGLFDGFDPENGRHLRGLGVGGRGRGLAQQERNVIGSAPEQRRRWRRSRGSDQGDGFDDLLFADVIAQQTVRIVQKCLRNGAGGSR